MSAKGKRVKNGRDDWIRTSDLTHPKRARYQAALRPDRSKTTPLRRRQGEHQKRSNRRVVCGIKRAIQLPLETPNSPVSAQIARKDAGDAETRLSLSPVFEKCQEAAERVAQVEEHLAVEHLGGVLSGTVGRV